VIDVDEKSFVGSFVELCLSGSGKLGVSEEGGESRNRKECGVNELLSVINNSHRVPLMFLWTGHLLFSIKMDVMRIHFVAT
jgi:hypothetical protein